jgi:DNA-binding response OmpR family regulator
MTYDESNPATLPRAVVEAPDEVHPTTTLCQCLVVSAEPNRREMLKMAAVESGWVVLVCHDAESAREETRRSLFRLALVDLDHAAAAADLRRLVEQIAAQRNVLVAVCGNDGDAREEIWARQLGTWLYLPGVTDAQDLVSPCTDARLALERMAGAKRTADGPRKAEPRRPKNPRF